MIDGDALKKITKKQDRKHEHPLGRASITIYDPNLKRRIDRLADDNASNFSSIVHNCLADIADKIDSPQTNLDTFGVDYPPPNLRDHNDKWTEFIKRLKTADDVDHVNVKLRQITAILNDRLNEIIRRERAIYESKRIGLSAEQIADNIREYEEGRL